ncbi:unnamed protein product [Effrenium voratum]|uniref:Uncharacterized protein n=1 Tax=Effrenium voratum TaxID=2562239 RepID=A0AA36IA97_9DINO|nr:unnamed protein product [Effrenium voratum]
MEDDENLGRWLQAYDELRARAVEHPSVLVESLPDLHMAPPSQHDGSQRNTARSQSQCLASYQAVIAAWTPNLGFGLNLGVPSCVLEEDEEDTPKSMDAFIEDLRQRHNAVAGCFSDDAKSELLLTKVFALLLGERYRSHGGVLFQYSQGAWSPAAGSISAMDLEYILYALRRAQAYFGLLSRYKPSRDFSDVCFEVRVLQALPEDALLEWQLNDIVGKRAAEKSRQWYVGSSDLCREMRKIFSEHNKAVVKNFSRWADSDMGGKQRAGVAFRDCFLAVCNGEVKQLRKDPRQGCYVYVPAALTWQAPDHARQRLASLLLSSFAGGDGLRMLLAQSALVAARLRQPDLMKACWGSGFGHPSSTLQVDREFQQQGLHFLHCVMLTFDECRRDHGLAEDVLKVFVGGGKMPLRKNHEADTKYASWEFCGKNWCMNVGDVPAVPTAEERSHARRIRCCFMRSSFSNQPEEIDVQRKVFLADPEAKQFCASNHAVWSFYHDWLFPFMQKHPPSEWGQMLEFCPEGSQAAKDTKWLLQRMARATTAASPDELRDNAPQPIGGAPAESFGQAGAVGQAQRLVLETHAAISVEFFTPHLINRTAVPSNPGTASLKSKGGEAILRFQRRPLVVDRVDDALRRSCESPEDVFGSWSDWKWPETQPAEPSWDELCDGQEPERFENGPAWECRCFLHLARLREYARRGDDRRQDQLLNFLEAVERAGAIEGDHATFAQKGRQKVVAGKPLGRFFFPHASLPSLTREARAACSPDGTVEFDQPNAIVHFIVEIANEVGKLVPCMTRYKVHKQAWRAAVARYYGVDDQSAKTLLLKACFGFAFPPSEQADLGTMERLAMEHFVAKLTEIGWLLVAPVYDAVLACPAEGTLPGVQDALLQEFADDTGIYMQVKPVRQQEHQHGAWASLGARLADMLQSGPPVLEEGGIEVVPGRNMCLPSALVNLFPGSITAGLFQDCSGPFTYQQCVEVCPSLTLEPVSIDQVRALGVGKFLAHEPAAGGEAHAYGILLVHNTATIFNSNRPRAISVPHSLLWTLLDETQGLQLFKADMNLLEHKAKRRRLARQPASLQQQAGMDAELAEDADQRVMDHVAASMDLEVRQFRQEVPTLQGGPFACKLCPFRSFARKDRLLAHVIKYHAKGKLFIANSRSQAQWNLALALHEQDQALSFLRPPMYSGSLLQASASIIRRVLESNNDIDMVMVLTATGPKCLLKTHTVNCARLHKKVYYDHTLANLLLSLALKHVGKIQTIYQELATHFVSQGCPCALMGLRNRSTRGRLLEDILSKQPVQELHAELLAQATRKGEWEVISHDATFKTLFAIIGQDKMAQREGELHALHTIVGKTGAVPGMSMQATEGRACFKRLSGNIARCCSGLHEMDALHLVLRLEACFGEKRPMPAPVYHGEAAPCGEEGRWSARKEALAKPERDLRAYSNTPYNSHQEYVDDLLDITLKFPTDMSRKDCKGRSAKQILMSGAAYRHFAYLRNGNHIASQFSAAETQLSAWGTTGNEALHFQINNARRTVLQQHHEAIPPMLFSFALQKMMAHNSAAYAPTLAQRSQAELLSLLRGHLSACFFSSFGDRAIPPLTNRDEARRPARALDQAKTQRAKAVAASQRRRWGQHAAKLERRRAKRSVPGPPRIKRTVFTKRKQPRLHRTKGQ